MLVKIVLGVTLLRTAWRYHDDANSTEHEEETYNMDLYTTKKDTHQKGQSGLIRERPPNARKSKPLSDIERFTLCSNRII